MVTFTGKIHCNFPSLVSGYILVSTQKKVPFFLHFSRDPLTPLWKLSSSKIKYLGDERVLLDLEEVRYILALARKIYAIGPTKNIHLQDPLTNSQSVILST